MSASSRVIPADGIHNFRDYGGYTALGGARLKRGRLFRSAQHRDASKNDLTLLLAHDIRAVIDLRGDAERAAHPCRRHSAFAGKTLFVEGETINPAMPPEPAMDKAGAVERMRSSYAEMPFRPGFQRSLALYFKALREEESATLVHCVAGKDRTGLAVALFHHLLGVHPDDIMEDYLLTNSAGRIEARIEDGAKTIRTRYGQSVPMETIRTLMSVDPSYLNTAIYAIIERHGSIELYAEKALGVAPAIRGALAELYLA